VSTESVAAAVAAPAAAPSAAPYGAPLSRREAGILAAFRERLRAVPATAGAGGMLAVF
jgi:hypothetical protein